MLRSKVEVAVPVEHTLTMKSISFKHIASHEDTICSNKYVWYEIECSDGFTYNYDLFGSFYDTTYTLIYGCCSVDVNHCCLNTNGHDQISDDDNELFNSDITPVRNPDNTNKAAPNTINIIFVFIVILGVVRLFHCINKRKNQSKKLQDVSDVVVADKEEQNRLKDEYFKLEKEMVSTTLTLSKEHTSSEEYQPRQDRIDQKWEDDNEADNLEALKCIRRHMPVMIRHISEFELANNSSPNGKYLPKSIAKKFKRTNILQCLRIHPNDLERMHPATLENMRVASITLTERRALYMHMKTLGPKWERNKEDKMTARKWSWYQLMTNNFKETLDHYLLHCAQYGPSSNHPYATRDNPNVGCPLLGKQCPVRADKQFDYSGDYGYPEGDEYEISNMPKQEDNNSRDQIKPEVTELARQKKANERAEILKKHYKGKLLEVCKANGSCESMDLAMDRMEIHTKKWIEFIIEKGSTDELEPDKNIENGRFTEALNELMLFTIDYAARSGMQMSDKKKAGVDSPDMRSSIEASLSEETFECTREFFSFIMNRMKEISTIDTRVVKAIDLLDAIWKALHEKNLTLLEALGVQRSQRHRKLKKNDDLRKEVEDKQKESEEVAPTKEATKGPPRPYVSGIGRGLLLDAIISGRGRGRGGNIVGRGGLIDAIAGRGRERCGDTGERGTLLDAIADRGSGQNRNAGGRVDLLEAIARGRGRCGDTRGRGGLLDAIASRGRGQGGRARGRGALLEDIARSCVRGRGGDAYRRAEGDFSTPSTLAEAEQTKEIVRKESFHDML